MVQYIKHDRLRSYMPVLFYAGLIALMMGIVESVVGVVWFDDYRLGLTMICIGSGTAAFGLIAYMYLGGTVYGTRRRYGKTWYR